MNKMQDYDKTFAEIYERWWEPYSLSIAPLLLRFLERYEIAKDEKSVLDLCCGTGQLSRFFLNQGYKVIGIDKSPHMLEFARKRNAGAIAQGKASFIEADAAHFRIEERTAFVVSTFDSLNHLDNLNALGSCFTSVYDTLRKGGIFVFDLNTRRGLQRWSGIEYQEDEELSLLKRGFFSEELGKGYTQITGFVYRRENLYEKFTGLFYNTAYDMENVKKALSAAGFSNVYFADIRKLSSPLKHPEEAGKVFIVAGKPY